MRLELFNIKDSISVPQFEDAIYDGYWQRFVYPIDIGRLHWSAMVVSDATGRVIRDGRPLVVSSDDTPACASVDTHCRVYTSDGYFLGVLRFHSGRGRSQPEKVFL